MAKSTKPQVKYAHPNLAHFFRLPGAQPGQHPQPQRSAREGRSSSSTRSGGSGGGGSSSSSSSNARRTPNAPPHVPPAPSEADLDTQRSSRRISVSSSVYPPSDAGTERPPAFPRCRYCGQPKREVSSTGTYLCRECDQVVVTEEE